MESAIDANEDLDRYEDDFVLEDEQNDLGVPTEDIPLEFTRHAYKQPKDYFRDVVYWMVQNKLNPAFPRSDPMFKMAFAKLEDEVKGRSGSQLISSVWSPEFIYAIQARPSMEVTSYPTEEDHPCDACRRSGHPASSDLKPYGKAYSLETLEPLNDDSDYSDEQPKEKHESDDDDDSNERDRDGHVIPPEGTHFYLGRLVSSASNNNFDITNRVIEHARDELCSHTPLPTGATTSTNGSLITLMAWATCMPMKFSGGMT